jgi:hypothetical protein
MPTTLLTGEPEGGFENRHYDLNWWRNQHESLAFDRSDILLVT